MIDSKTITSIVDQVMALDLEELRATRVASQGLYDRAKERETPEGTEWTVGFLKLAVESLDALITYRETLETLSEPFRDIVGLSRG